MTLLACPDFTGSYVRSGEEFDTTLQVRQEGCEAASWEFREGEYPESLRMLFDGRLRPTLETPGELFEQSQRWNGAEIQAEERYFWRASGSRMRVEARYRLDPQSNLIVEKDAYDGEGRFQGHYSGFFRKLPLSGAR